MAEYSDRMKNERQSSNALSDYDKQFQQDLERAAALSLESLALEKFRQQKQKDDQHSQPSQYSRSNRFTNFQIDFKLSRHCSYCLF